MQKKSRASAIINGKCPRCRQGDMFKHSALNITGFHKMNKQCPVCGVYFEQEPGFFFGAMYISYAFSVAIFVAVGIVLSVLDFFTLDVYIITVVASVVILLPFLFRYSRIIFLYAFGGIDFDPKFSN